MSSQALQQSVQLFVCKGTPYERGVLQGAEFKRQIALSFNAFFQSDAFQLLKPFGMPQSWAVKMACSKARRQFAGHLQRSYPHFLEQMRGLAEGSGQSYNQFLFACAVELLLAEVNYHVGGCSALAIPPGFSTQEEPLLIKNFDYPFFLKTSNLVRQTVPQEGLASLEVTLYPSVGCHTGLNQAGVAITYNYGYGRDKAQDFIPISLRVQEALRTCESVADVVRLFNDHKQAGGGILTVLDDSGAISLIEISSGQVSVKPITNNLLLSTNHYQTASMLPRDIPVNAYYTFKKNIPELAGRRVRESSEARFDRLSHLTGTKIQFHESDLLDYFRDHHRSAGGNDNTLCRHGEYYETTCSVLLRPRSRQIQVALGNPCETVYQTFGLS